MHANSVLFLSHTAASLKLAPAGLGEIANSAKLRQLFINQGIKVDEIVDIFELFGDFKELYEPLYTMNYALAEEGEAMIEEVEFGGAPQIKERLGTCGASHLVLLSGCWSSAALFGVGIQRVAPTIVKLYVQHPTQIVFPMLYAPGTLMITESLLANERAIRYGIPSWKLMHIPHHFPLEIEKIEGGREKIEKMAARYGKRITPSTVIVGAVMRFEYGKNCEAILDAVEAMASEGKEILFVLKGDFVNTYPLYRAWLEQKIDRLKDQPWFLWEKERSTLPETLRLMHGFDIFMHLSGAEAGSNVIVEALALGLPSLILDATTNPSLFKEGAIFVQTTGEIIKAVSSFFIPSPQDLQIKLRELIDDPKKRQEYSVRAKRIAYDRFHPARTYDRLPLLLEASHAYFHRSGNLDTLKLKLDKLYEQDLKRYEG